VDVNGALCDRSLLQCCSVVSREPTTCQTDNRWENFGIFAACLSGMRAVMRFRGQKVRESGLDAVIYRPRCCRKMEGNSWMEFCSQSITICMEIPHSL
jgi:hypothetical protein